jgi:hypothetical protein
MQDYKVIIETVGTISKKEDLVIFENSKNVLAFETAHAYPGYNGVVPQNYDPNSVFLITKERYLTEKIFKVSQKIRSKVSFSFNAAFATVNYQNREYPAIRLKELENYSFMSELLNEYVAEGVHFEKAKSTKPFNTLIHVTKGFHLEPMENSCYKDLADDQMYYFEIPEDISWDKFEKMITDIKYNSADKNFDAALSLFYRVQRIVYAVRLFKKSLSTEELDLIKDKFLKLL